ncbi:DegT/DnrJ/EryC1/StrS family aminotransferase [Qiania dongpingensis]|uniref:DegT/DnrJ/EryC1/StrS family aminotransferase n=1 Tax=Qiania dongpingensis TaxID=2763669 RepID=A0A7G9G1G0_9FIRM|nr:DegT/DnrJ/EryC1/StrS family aminotransferase [Qiania dongpingensis]QNM04642.1 DegT/DnrJ/EryC1/StrS family aminotransferase [Qiania dongpingensis]
MPGPGAFWIGEEEINEVVDVLKSGHLSRYGKLEDPNFRHKVISFEEEFAKFSGARHCLAVSGGTSALINCLVSMGVGPGDEVIVPGYTFVATMSAVLFAKAIPILAEIDDSLTMDPDDFEKKITPRTKAVIPVHMLGNPCRMDRIMEIADRHGIAVLEDSCQACGATYRGRPVGSFGKMSAFSLNIFKTITAGDGGMLTTDDDELFTRAFAFHDQGHLPYRAGAEIGGRTIIGMNQRVNEVSGAVALAQVRKLPLIISTLRRNKERLKSRLQGLPGFKFRTINDEGECGTILTLIFDTKELADRFCKEVNTKVVYESGWHVYAHMEQILGKCTSTAFKCPYECPVYGREVSYTSDMLPKTDDILMRSVNISVGVVDAALAAGFGVNINSTDAEIDRAADKMAEVIQKISF